MTNFANIAGENRVTRVPPSEKLLATSISHLKQKITAKLKGEYASFEQNAQHLAKAFSPIRTLIEQDPHAVASLDVLYKLAKKDQRRRIQADKQLIDPGLATTFTFTANPGSFSVIAPPYDVQWTTPDSPKSAVTRASKDTGELYCQLISGGRYDRAAAVGVFLSSPVRSLVRFSPVAPFSWSWELWNQYGQGTSTKGGVGVMAYLNADSKPFLDKQAILWNESRVNPSLGEKDFGGSWISAALFPGTVSILMEPGNTYLVWVWCWVMRHTWVWRYTPELGTVYAKIGCSVPFIVVDSGPPPHIG